MKTTITRALAVLASLSIGLGLASTAQAQEAPRRKDTYTFSPSALTLNAIGNLKFKVVYKLKSNLNSDVCSDKGVFSTDPTPTDFSVLGDIRREVKIRGAYPYTAAEEGIVPAGVVEKIKRQRITQPVYYVRTWVYCGPKLSTRGLTAVPVTFISFGVEASPATARVATGNDTLVPVRWKATFGAGTSSRVESRLGRFVDGRGRVYEPVALDPLQATGGSPLEFNETLRLPEIVVRQVLAGDGSGIRFERLFVLDGLEAIAAVQLNFTGRSTAPFSIGRAELRFLDGSRFKTVALGEEVLLEAALTFSGGGKLRGSWDLAGPSTTPGAATFVRKELVDEYLSFGRQALIRSPAFKAEQPGLYYVRLSITEPNLGAAGILQLSFVVRATAEAVAIPLVQPPPLARLVTGMPFVWEAVPGARNYLLEFYTVPITDGREPAAGMILPGGASRARLSPATEHNLQPGSSYWWRVIALGPDGVLLGQSPLRELLTAQD